MDHLKELYFSVDIPDIDTSKTNIPQEIDKENTRSLSLQTGNFAGNEEVAAKQDPPQLKELQEKEQQIQDMLKVFNRESAPIPTSEFVYLTNQSSDAFKSFGIRENFPHEHAKLTEHEADGSFTRSLSSNDCHLQPQVTFSTIDTVEVRTSPKGFFESSASEAAASSVPVLRYSYIREKPSSSKAEILTVSQNIITITEDSMAVTPSEELDEERWEVEEGYMISTLLKRVPMMTHLLKPLHHPPKDRQAILIILLILLLSYSPVTVVDPIQSKQFYQPPGQDSKVKYMKESEQLKCSDFLSPVAAANLFVTNMIKQAKAEHRKLIAMYGDPEKWSVFSGSVMYKLGPSRWPSIEKFTEEEGLFFIENYIVEKSSFLEDWRYTVVYRGAQSDCVSDHHYYQVEFGLPNKLYPVPQVTVSLYFYMEVSRVIPPQCPVKVLLKLEAAHHRVDPEKFALNDFTLLGILHIKLDNIKQVSF